MKRAFLLLLPAFLCWKISVAQSFRADYRFFVAGHTYGKPEGKSPGLYPPFIRSFSALNNTPFLPFGFLNGDIVRTSSPEAWDQVEEDLGWLNVPTFKVPGNHDYIGDYSIRKARYGPNWFHFSFKNDLFIVLDGTWDNWNIQGAQLEWLKRVLSQKGPAARQVFVVVHQLIWVPGDARFSEIVTNDPLHAPAGTNFREEVEPLFRALDKPVWFVGGDLAANDAAWGDMGIEDGNLRFLGTGMGAGEGKDNFLLFEVNKKGAVRVRKVWLPIRQAMIPENAPVFMESR